MSPAPETTRRFTEYTRTLDCVHCGLCIPQCPTHRVTGREADSPRGRIHLLRGWAEGRFQLTNDAHGHLDTCIVCRTCESICPSGIRMGDMMETFRAEQRSTRPDAGPSRTARWFLRSLVPYRSRIRALSGMLAVYQGLGLRRAMDALLRPLWPRAARAHAMQPTLPPARDRNVPTDRERPGGFPAVGSRRARVALFLGCVASEWFADVHRATIHVLRRNGCDVIVPDGQTCCGALHRHAGMRDEARSLLRRNAAVFTAAEVDAVLVNAAGCGASLKEPLEAGPEVPYRDICEFLHELGLREPTRPVPRRVVYDPPCHLLHAQRIDVVEELLARIPELELRPLPGRDRCCGAGGVYNLLHPELADAVLAEKVEAILGTGADTVATGNPGCALQLVHGLRATSLDVTHPVQLLADAYEAVPAS